MFDGRSLIERVGRHTWLFTAFWLFLAVRLLSGPMDPHPLGFWLDLAMRISFGIVYGGLAGLPWAREWLRRRREMREKPTVIIVSRKS